MENNISVEEFKKLNIVIGEIKSAEKVPDTDKLLKLSVDLGEESPRQIISGISEFFSDESKLVGKKCTFAANLEPKTIRGLESQGMILAISTPEGGFSLLVPETDIPSGSSIR
jgi:methionyl-tRNA synthetase|tara:strand:- start:6463 stop:6801 length:339 start_codon:yes stop_codon:yes gene_type:complete